MLLRVGPSHNPTPVMYQIYMTASGNGRRKRDAAPNVSEAAPLFG